MLLEANKTKENKINELSLQNINLKNQLDQTLIKKKDEERKQTEQQKLKSQ